MSVNLEALANQSVQKVDELSDRLDKATVGISHLLDTIDTLKARFDGAVEEVEHDFSELTHSLVKSENDFNSEIKVAMSSIEQLRIKVEEFETHFEQIGTELKKKLTTAVTFSSDLLSQVKAHGTQTQGKFDVLEPVIKLLDDDLEEGISASTNTLQQIHTMIQQHTQVLVQHKDNIHTALGELDGLVDKGLGELKDAFNQVESRTSAASDQVQSNSESHLDTTTTALFARFTEQFPKEIAQPLEKAVGIVSSIQEGTEKLNEGLVGQVSKVLEPIEKIVELVKPIEPLIEDIKPFIC
jgi:ABC-type transporter Mla subunit MlaD